MWTNARKCEVFSLDTCFKKAISNWPEVYRILVFQLPLGHNTMIPILVLLTTLTTLVLSQPSIGTLPACAIPCVNNAIAASGCPSFDVFVLHARFPLCEVDGFRFIVF